MEIKSLLNGSEYYKTQTKTNGTGGFSVVIPTPFQPGITTIKAKLVPTTLESLISVLVREPSKLSSPVPLSLTSLIPLVAITINIIILVVSYPKYEKFGLIAAGIIATIGFIFINEFDEFYPGTKAALQAAVTGSVVANVYDAIKARREAGRAIEKTVGTTRDTQLQKEVDSMSAIFEEISSHQAIFGAKNEMLSKKLLRTEFMKSTKTGKMTNLPGLRINQYYYYIGYYNKLVEYKVLRRDDLSDDKKYQEFYFIFGNIKSSYSKLNQLLYVNLLYTIGEIQHTFLSFPTIKFPLRLSKPLLDLLQKSDADFRNDLTSDKIYKAKIGYKLMAIISKEFKVTLSELETYFLAVIEFVPPPTSEEEQPTGQGGGTGEQPTGQGGGTGEQPTGQGGGTGEQPTGQGGGTGEQPTGQGGGTGEQTPDHDSKF
jgi:hypothetical protein